MTNTPRVVRRREREKRSFSISISAREFTALIIKGKKKHYSRSHLASVR